AVPADDGQMRARILPPQQARFYSGDSVCVGGYRYVDGPDPGGISLHAARLRCVRLLGIEIADVAAQLGPERRVLHVPAGGRARPAQVRRAAWTRWPRAHRWAREPRHP